MSYSLPLNLQWMVQDEIRNRKKKSEQDTGIRERERALLEDKQANDSFRQTQLRQDILDEGGRLRGEAAQSSLTQNNDAFEVTAGRMDPDLFNMKYGGGAVPGGGMDGARQMANGVGAGGVKGAITDQDLFNQYNKRSSNPEDEWEDFHGKNPGIEIFKTMYGAGGQQQRPLTPWEETRLKNSKEVNSGRDTTADFRAGVSSELMKDGSMRFSDSGPRTDDSRMGWNPEVEAGIAKRREIFAQGGAKALSQNISGWGNQPPPLQAETPVKASVPVVSAREQASQKQPPTTSGNEAVVSQRRTLAGDVGAVVNGAWKGLSRVAEKAVSPLKSALSYVSGKDVNFMSPNVTYLGNGMEAGATTWMNRLKGKNDDGSTFGTKLPKYKKDKSAIRQWQHDNMPPWYKR